MILWGDIETFSECDLKTAGTHRYAEHPSTRIIVWQWAIDDGEPVVEDLSDGSMPSNESMRLLLDPNVTLVFHNSTFDRTVIRHVWGLDIPVERWQDTMVKALAHGLPGSLDKIGQILGLEADEAKDKRGRELIQLFCKPRPKGSKLRRATRETHPAEWAKFVEYARLDVEAMRDVDKKLPAWNYQAGELALWHLDQTINDRGVMVDTELADDPTTRVAAVRIPLGAVAQRGELSGVYVRQGERLLLRQLRLGAREGDSIEVISGLAPGEVVASDPVAATQALAAQLMDGFDRMEHAARSARVRV